MTEKRFTQKESLEYLKNRSNGRYIITIANEFLDTKTDEWLSIEQVFERLNHLNEQEDKLKRIEKEVNNCNIYRDDLKDITLEIRCILNGDV